MWLRLWLAVLFVLAGAVFLPRIRAYPDSASVLHLSECQLPCWIGIVPGETTLDEAVQRVRAYYGGEITREDTSTHLSPCCVVSTEFTVDYPEHHRSLWITLSSQTDLSAISAVSDIYLHIFPDYRGDALKLSDLMLLVGKPSCLAARSSFDVTYPVMIYAEYSVELTLMGIDFADEHTMSAHMGISDKPIPCDDKSIPWQGILHDYTAEFIAAAARR